MKRKVTVDIPEGKYCNLGEKRNACRFIEYDAIGWAHCAIYDDLLGKYKLQTLLKCDECLGVDKQRGRWWLTNFIKSLT